MSTYYETYFGFTASEDPGGRLIALRPASDGAALHILQAGKGLRTSQAAVKLVFDIEDVSGFRKKCLAAGLKFGPIHDGGGYEYANTKDPGGNSVQISNRAFKKND